MTNSPALSQSLAAAAHWPATTTGCATTGLYVHIPFCAKKCPYCDFNTYAGLESLQAATVKALCREMAQRSPLLAERHLSTIFIGGGTPTVLSAAELTALFTAIDTNFHIAPNCEITCEVNPGTVDRSKFQILRELGVNRLSIGVQSFQSSELRFLGRVHNVEDVYSAFDQARKAGFDNINLDFMFGLAEQSPAIWQDTLDRALALAPEHLSLYSLIVEPNTPLYHWVERGRTQVPDEDETAVHYAMAMDALHNAGYTHYEVSNWAQSADLASQHNLIYWRNGEYLGIGPGAHSHLRLAHPQGADGTPHNVPANTEEEGTNGRNRRFVDRRWGNRKPVQGYIKRIERDESVEDFSEILSPALAMAETMMLGLRLVTEGVSFARFLALHGVDLRTVFAAQLAQLCDWGMLDVDAQRVKLTEQGLMVGNQVFMQFLPDEPSG